MQFAQNSDLKEHFKNEHNNVEKFECNICKKKILKRITTFGDISKIPRKENYSST